MKDTALVIMAAGIGSRFGGGVKQLAKLGPHGEIIIDYSIHDALAAGFNKVIFIIRKDIEEDFREVIGNRMEKITDVAYAFQSLDDLPTGFAVPEGRKKPWGTGHAILAARHLIDCPFAVINADDYYGPEGFRKVHDYLINDMDERGKMLDLCMAGYILGNTLSENGAVTRGVCTENEDGNLKSVTETFEIEKKNGEISGTEEDGTEVKLPADAIVSMNMWGLTPRFVKQLEERFPQFLQEAKGNLKAEYLLPQVIGDLVEEQKAVVKVLHTQDRWFGVTYADDKPAVQAALAALHSQGIYGEKLFD